MSGDKNKDSKYVISKVMEQGNIDERKNVEIEVRAPNKEDVLELYDEALNP